MVRYCESHGHAWSHAHPGRRGENRVALCPVAPADQSLPCAIISVDAAAKINELAAARK